MCLIIFDRELSVLVLLAGNDFRCYICWLLSRLLLDVRLGLSALTLFLDFTTCHMDLRINISDI